VIGTLSPAAWTTRWYRPTMVGLAAVILAGGAAWFAGQAFGPFGVFWGVDLEKYLAATQRWLDTGSPYLASEVAAPFGFGVWTYLHPPVAMLLFAPFLVLPAALWWVIPLGVTGWCVWSMRPAPWVWPIIAAGLAWPRFHGAVIVGNTDLWVLAGVAAGLWFGWPALVVAVKPSLVILGLAGIRHRSWWAGALVAAALCVPFGWLWWEWLQVILHAPGGLTYSLGSLPFLLVPVVAWIGRTTVTSGTRPGSR
jgi:hypothetical protein